MKNIIWLMLCLGLCSCAAQYPKNLRVPDTTPLISFQDVLSDQKGNVGLQGRWGGVIAGVQNHQSTTEIEVVQFPLRNNGRPEVEGQTQGRFKIVVKGFLDPVVYQQGKVVTALGTIRDSIQGKIGEHPYLFPALTDVKIYLWPEVKEVEYIEPWPYWHHHHWYHGPYLHRVKVKKSK
ncbi:Slp family lipoprotein [Algicola sagamiensis]|uniref:Slp family lipoprotein n=1 Tax=Algicola sagamiensis TaxID=163869 RepID=UPI0003A5C476|nr:Slp/YeaY family lipoprotein [Algicola sagamiensis]